MFTRCFRARVGPSLGRLSLLGVVRVSACDRMCPYTQTHARHRSSEKLALGADPKPVRMAGALALPSFGCRRPNGYGGRRRREAY
jgi:hypothetical protein